MKKASLLLMTLAVIIALAACGSPGEEAEVVTPYTQETTQQDYEPAQEEPPVQHTEDDEEPTAYEPEEEPQEEPPAAPAATLTGVFVNYEYDDGITLTFSPDGTFAFAMSYDSLELGIDIPGYVSFGGNFSVNEAAGIISLEINEDSLRGMVGQIINLVTDLVLEHELGELGDLAQDEEFVELFISMMLMVMDEMFDDMFAEMLAEFEHLELTFDDNFDRLFGDDDSVIIRQELAPPRQAPSAPLAQDRMPTIGQITPELVGTWYWMDIPYYQFNDDGTGAIVVAGFETTLNWSTANGVLYICSTTDVCLGNCLAPDEWIYLLDGDTLILVSNQIADLVFEYTRG